MGCLDGGCGFRDTLKAISELPPELESEKGNRREGIAGWLIELLKRIFRR